RGTDWSEVRGALGSQSLFGGKRIVEIRLASGRMRAPLAALIEECAKKTDPGAVLLVTMPRIEGSGWWKAGWFVAFEREGMVIEAQPVARAMLPAWIARPLPRPHPRARAA